MHTCLRRRSTRAAIITRVCIFLHFSYRCIYFILYNGSQSYTLAKRICLPILFIFNFQHFIACRLIFASSYFKKKANLQILSLYKAYGSDGYFRIWSNSRFHFHLCFRISSILYTIKMFVIPYLAAAMLFYSILPLYRRVIKCLSCF